MILRNAARRHCLGRLRPDRRYRATAAALFLATLPSFALTETAESSGAVLFAEYCAACHGTDAKGSKAQAGSMAPDLTQIADRRGGVWPMLEVMSIIDGYARTTQVRAGMPVISALGRGPKVAFDTGNGQLRHLPKRLVDVAAYLESLQSPKPTRFVP